MLLVFVIDSFGFLTKSRLCNRFFLNLNGLFEGKVVSFNKNDNGSLV